MAEAIVREGLREGDAVVVTGAAQGIGRAIALRLARSGARLALWDIQGEAVAETARLCREAGAADVRAETVDVGVESDVERATAAAVEAWGAPFGLVNDAGIYPRAAVLDMDLALWERVLRTNLTGHFLCARAVGRHMVAAGRGAIVNTSSGRALSGAERGAHYAASKGGIISLTKSLALEWAKHGVRVNCVLPGIVETAMPLQGAPLEEVRARGARVIPMGRLGQPEDIAGVVMFLLSSDAAFMTGQAIAPNGGEIMVS